MRREEVEEERRLFYVAVTRAKKSLSLVFRGTNQ
jgi:ATP-dependent exoDNAse (exonuclease V) beta subunit